MNSTATAVVTDFLRPFNALKSERAYLNAGRVFTLVLGTLGTLAGLLFVSPDVRLLLDVYFKVIGMFMGLLGGLFALGVLTRRASGWGAAIGLCAGLTLTISVWQFTKTEGYLYSAISIVGCLTVGYAASFLGPPPTKPIEGLTIHSMSREVGK
jgi:Na+/proline symporter